MTYDLMLNNLLDEMKAKGSLTALNDTVLEISRIAKKPESSIIELAMVIMRDCGVASNLLATVNSAYYAPRFPITTISSAVTDLGFEKVFLLAFGLGLFRISPSANSLFITPILLPLRSGISRLAFILSGA